MSGFLASLRHERGRLVAILARVTGGDLEAAEDALSAAIVAALESWPRDGEPREPRSWLLQVARHKAIDQIRRNVRMGQIREQVGRAAEEVQMIAERDHDLPDDRLALIYTCCHPALSEAARIGLTLRAVCGLTTEEIGRLYLQDPRTLAQTLVRAQRKIRDAGIRYEVPPPRERAGRLASVLHVIYLVFTEGYAATTGDAWIRDDLCEEAIRLARLVATLEPDDGEVWGLLGLILLQDARRAARTSATGDLILLEDQDRSSWHPSKIAEGRRALRRGFELSPPGPYLLQAAIADTHVRAPDATSTDWEQIQDLYRLLRRAAPSPMVDLNLAVATAMAEGPDAGLLAMSTLDAALGRTHLLPAARADLLRRAGRRREAAEQYSAALDLARNGVERRFLARRLAEVSGPTENDQDQGEE